MNILLLKDMQKNPKFDDIRPYYEDEIPAAMARIAESSSLPLLAAYVYPDESNSQLSHSERLSNGDHAQGQRAGYRQQYHSVLV